MTSNSSLLFARDAKEQINERFRKVAKSYSQLFYQQKDYIHTLLDGGHNQSSGIFRESLLKNFLETVLPKAVSVDSGFIYGFDQLPSSKQIDILVWDSMRHSAVYQTKDFVIITPESVIAAISVKSNSAKSDIEHSLENLLSVSRLEIRFRSQVGGSAQKPLYRPITKIAFFYNSPNNIERVSNQISHFFMERFASEEELAREMVEAFSNCNPMRLDDVHAYQVERILPKLVLSVDENDFSLIQGWGPPDDLSGDRTYGQSLKRLPYLYPQGKNLTTPLEKMVYEILTSVYIALNTQGWSLVAAWGDLDPVTGSRVGDASEIISQQGLKLLDPDRLAGYGDPTVPLGKT